MKDIFYYIKIISKGELSIIKGYVFFLIEQFIREVIEILMCNGCIDWRNFLKCLYVLVFILKVVIVYDEKKLFGFVDDGLIYYIDDYFEMIIVGLVFVCNVVVLFDKLMFYFLYLYLKFL